MTEYGKASRELMQMEIEKEDREWHRLNVVQYGYIKANWLRHRENLIVVLAVFFTVLLSVVLWLALAGILEHARRLL